MPSPEAVRHALRPICETISGLDLSNPAEAELTLNHVHPLSGLAATEGLLRGAHLEGLLTARRATPTLTFGRLAKPGPETAGLSIDVVDMAGAGGEHVHPSGEVSLCLVLEGNPRFCGRPPGWVVVAPGSRHVPLVEDGRMLIAYFLPDGAMTFL